MALVISWSLMLYLWSSSQATNSGESHPCGEDCSSGAFSDFSSQIHLLSFCIPSPPGQIHLCLLKFCVHRIDLLTFRCSRSRTRPEGQVAQEENTPHSQRLLLTPRQCHLLVAFSCAPLFQTHKSSAKNILLQSPQPNSTQFSPLTFILLSDYIHLTFALFISCNIRQIIASCYSFHISTFDKYTILLPAPMDNPL